MLHQHPHEVMVAHESPLVRAGLIAILGQQADMRVTGCDPSGAAPWRERCVHVVVGDHATGLRCLRDVGAASPGWRGEPPRVLIVGAEAGEWEVREALRQGVYGYLLLGCASERFVEGVRAVRRGSRYLDESVAARLADSVSRTELTPRELEVLRLLARGSPNKTIAQSLGIQVGTVKAHVKAILEKLCATSRTHAASLAEQRGLLRTATGIPAMHRG